MSKNHKNHMNKKMQESESEQIDPETTSETEQVRSGAGAPDYLLPASVLISALILAGAWVYTTGIKATNQQAASIAASAEKTKGSEREEMVVPSGGVVLPITWNDLGAKLVSSGVIDADKFKAIYDQRGAFTDEYRNLLLGQNDGKLKITNENAGYLLNLFWALGLANKNEILETGEMTNPAYGGAQNFASTGGWTIAKGDPMSHYSMHRFFALTPEQQARVDKVSRGIYRPCCGNSVHFPDCNHGMAMLGLLELMASQGVSEPDMWKTALVVNSYWFPDTYLTIAAYMKHKGVDWNNVDPREVLGVNYSSAQGYANVASRVIEPQQQRGGNGCGVDAGTTAAPQRQPGGCGV